MTLTYAAAGFLLLLVLGPAILLWLIPEDINDYEDEDD